MLSTSVFLHWFTNIFGPITRLIFIEDVDDGSTVTDFLPAERARGVTIQSAAITFHWPPLPQEGQHTGKTQKAGTPLLIPASRNPYTINLIDTPGHADFTFEVLRSLRVLDGAVCILDGVAGVEAQTEKVWYQAAKYHIPKIIYINKLDRDGAAFGKTVKEIASRLFTWPAVCQIPWWEGGKGRFMGVGDVIGLKAYRWADGGDGKTIEAIDLDDIPLNDASFGQEIKKARVALVELLSEHDDTMVEKYLAYDENHLAIPAADLTTSLRRCVLDITSNIAPVFAGASFRNIGVQPLLDAVVNILPNPSEAKIPEVSVGNIKGSLTDLLDGKLLSGRAEAASKSKKKRIISPKSSTAIVQSIEACALAFKVVHDPRRGTLVYVRVYSGVIQRNTSLFNTNLQISERAPRLLTMYASDSVEVPDIPAGQIGVILGLKFARTGDTLISYRGANPKTGPPAPLNSLQLRPIEVPPAVFFSSIESRSLDEEKAVADALALLIREDPSLQLNVDEDSGQTLLSGMGEFHLEIAEDRLMNELKAKATVGKIEIAYRESILLESLPETCTFDQEMAGKRGKASCVASIRPLTEDIEPDAALDDYTNTTNENNNQIITFINSTEDMNGTLEPWNGKLPSHLPLPLLHAALKNGALAALGRGAAHGFPLANTQVSLTIDPRTQIFGSETTSAAIQSAARLATKAAIKNSTELGGSSLMELVMNVTISTDEASLGAVVNDISSSRGGHIISLDDADVVSTVDRNATREDLPVIDVRKVYVPPDPFAASQSGDNQVHGGMDAGSRQRSITARVPLKEMVGYLKHLRSLTGGRGTFVMSADRFERVVGQREQVLLKELRGF